MKYEDLLLDEDNSEMTPDQVNDINDVILDLFQHEAVFLQDEVSEEQEKRIKEEIANIVETYKKVLEESKNEIFFSPQEKEDLRMLLETLLLKMEKKSTGNYVENNRFAIVLTPEKFSVFESMIKKLC